MDKEEQIKDQQEKQEEDVVEITYYTDPLCCWSWAFEPQWRRLRYEFSGKLKWRYRMCGMLPDWNSYDDPLNSVSRPLQMGPLWLEAKHISGMPIKEDLWFHDPPASSYPACVAVKCAGLQSPEAEEWYLRRTREAIMLKGQNIAKQEVLLEIAKTLSKDKPHLFSHEQFQHDMKTEAGNDPFRNDLQKARYHSIGRYPSLTMQKAGQEGVIMTGYRPYDVLLDGIKQVAPDIKPTQDINDKAAFEAYWGSLTERESAETGSVKS